MKTGVVVLTSLAAALLAGQFGCSSGDHAAGHRRVPVIGEDPEIHRLLHTHRPWLPDGPAPGVEDYAPFAACFDSENPPTEQTVATVNALIRGSLAKYNAVDRWTSTSVNGAVAAGVPITLRISFVPDTVNAPNLSNVFAPSTLFASMDAKFGGNRQLWISKIQEAFARWGALTGTTYVWVSAPGQDWDDGAAWGSGGNTQRGDVRIAMRALDGGGGVLAFNSYPNNGDMVLDSAENWQSSNNNYRFLRNIIMHEHGHGLGLAHVCPVNSTKLLEPTYSSAYDGPQQDDLRGIQFRYGDANEPNGTPATATLMGGVNPGQSFTIGTIPAPAINQGSLVSLHIDGDNDYYRFDLSAPALVSTTVTPLGTTYDAATQGSTCPSGSPVNALTQGDVAVAVLGSDGVTVRGVDADGAPGVAETASSVLVPGGLPFYVRVYETGALTQTQMYRLTVSTSAVTGLSASDGTFFDKVNLSWNAIPGVTTYALWRSESQNRNAALPLVNTDQTTFADTSAEPGVTYWYWLRAGQSGQSAFDVAGPSSGFRSPCRADVGGQGGVAGADGSLDNNDFIVFIDYYFDGDVRADFAGQGGTGSPDGTLDNNDLIAFIDAFFAGC